MVLSIIGFAAQIVFFILQAVATTIPNQVLAIVGLVTQVLLMGCQGFNLKNDITQIKDRSTRVKGIIGTVFAGESLIQGLIFVIVGIVFVATIPAIIKG